MNPEVGRALSEILTEFPGGFNSPSKLSERRELISRYLRQFPKVDGVVREDSSVTSLHDGVKVPIRTYRPSGGVRNDGIVLSIHGGGMVMGSIDDDDGNASRLCLELATTVVAVQYRLAPENSFPTPFEDCYSVASWILLHSGEIGVDKSKSIIYGGSAGGGLAIATALALRDRMAQNFSAIVAPYPMLDFRNSLPSTKRIVDLGVWDRDTNEESWDWYLGKGARKSKVSGYASPFHAEDLSSLPPMFIDVGSCDLFLDEDLLMAQRLLESGTPTELHCYPGAFHACELFAPDADLSKAIWRNRFEFMIKRLNPDV